MNNIQAKDLISLGLFTVLYFVLGCCVAIPIGFVPIFLPVLGTLWAIITGIPFMLYVTRVKIFRADHPDGDPQWATHGAHWHGILGRAAGCRLRAAR